MTKSNKKQKVNSDAVPTPKQTSVVSGEQKTTTEVSRFVVTRNGLRVSDREYDTETDEQLVAERDFWQRVINRWPDGTKIEVVPFDKKRHSVWKVGN